MIDAVCVVGDLLRPNGDGSAGGSDHPTLWLFNALKRQVHRAVQTPVEILSSATADLRPQIEALRPAAEADAFWAAAFGQLPDTTGLSNWLDERLHRRFVIGYEMPPWLVSFLTRTETPYIDIRLHPVRFLDDLLFAARASDPDTQCHLMSLAVHESEVLATAGLREAMCRFISQANVPDGTLLIAGQRRFDSTQILNGGFFDAMERAAEIHTLCAQYPAVVLKPHPLDRYHSLLVTAAGAPAKIIGVIEDNIYRMMSLPQIAAVLTVNSGVAQEAPYFGKVVHMLAQPAVRTMWRDSHLDVGAHVSLTDIVLTPDFWRIVLAPHHEVTPPDGVRLPPKPNRLRIALDSFWNFNEIDTDRIPRGAAVAAAV
jgi:hypothetical protein